MVGSFHRVSLALAISALLLPPAARAQVCDASAFGPPTLDPITITGSWTVGNGCLLDFGDRTVILDGTLNIASAEIRAGDFELLNSGSIVGGAGALTIKLVASSNHAGAAWIDGAIELDHPTTGGTMWLIVDGLVNVGSTGLLRANATSSAGNGGTLEVLAVGAITLEGRIEAKGAPTSGNGGSIVISGSELALRGDLIATAAWGGWIELDSLGGAELSGEIRAESLGGIGYGGNIGLEAWGGTVQLFGAKLVSDGAGSSGSAGRIGIYAAGDLLSDAATTMSASCGPASGRAGIIRLQGCQVVVPAGCRIISQGSWAPEPLSLSARDLLEVHGELDGGSRTVRLVTRLAAPWSPDLSGATISPTHIVVHDQDLAPCLGLGFVEVKTNSPVHVNQGQWPAIQVESSPNCPLVVLASWTTGSLPLGQWGWLQLDPASSYRLADPGVFGPPVAGSVTDANGFWTWAGPPASASYIGRTGWVEVLVEDPALARNGWFHQAARVGISFEP